MNIVVFIQDEGLLARVEDGLRGRPNIKYAEDFAFITKEVRGNSDTVIIADFDSEDGRGYELISEVMAAATDEFPFIVLITEAENRIAAVDCIGTIPGDFLLKPLDLQEFSARLSLAEKTLNLQRRIREDRKIEQPISIYDPVTGLLNKEAIYERSLEEVNRAVREKSAAALAIISIENGSELQDDFGKEVYEQALRLVARSLKANVRLYDLVGRWMGSKFMVMLLGATLDNGIKALERVYKSVSTVVVKLPEQKRAHIELRVAITRAVHETEKPLYVLVENLNAMINNEEDDHWMAVF